MNPVTDRAFIATGGSNRFICLGVSCQLFQQKDIISHCDLLEKEKEPVVRLVAFA